MPDLDGHVFDSRTRSSVEKFNEVLDNIRIYVGRTYKHPDMVIEAIDQMRKPVLAEPPDLDASATLIKKKLWEERVKRFIEKEDMLEENLKRLYILLWGQCSDIMQAELKPCQATVHSQQAMMQLGC